MTRYELFLRTDGAPRELDVQALAAAAAEAALGWEPARDAVGVVQGGDLCCPLDGPPGIDALCDLAFDLAARHMLGVFDPQLGRGVSLADRDAIRQCFEQSRAVLEGAGPVSVVGTQARTRLWLYVVGLAILLALLSRLVRC